ncbi:PREDICTED: alanine aminotransferase 2-like [Rhagoletis zephyria]|uniref:alanine aminotransferase 2-like n=1 Tax=Rhagoletis zephyria TaxID=28612 RepID=UPI0008112691|nr:PREDICTED: alanine aminotransferase 2-like [Rhagoletis zephyria]
MNRISTAVYRHWNASLVNISQANTSRSCRRTAVSLINGKREMSTTSSQNAATAEKCLSLDNINPQFIELEYAVRGPLVIRAGQIEKELAQVSGVLSVK